MQAVTNRRLALVRDRARRFLPRLNPSFAVGLGILVSLLIIAFAVPVLSSVGPNEIAADDSLAPPSWQHLLGADDLGRDVLVRVAVGYRVSLEVAVGSVLLALLCGVPLGLAAGYAQGKVDSLVMRPLEVLMGFPPILLAIILIAVAGTGAGVLILALGIVYVPIITRSMRASALLTVREAFIKAAQARGATHMRIALRHVLPNSLGLVVVQASLLMGWAVLLEAALSFVGLGVRPPTPALGSMIAAERDYMVQAPWVVIAPGFAIMLLVLSFNLIGDGLGEWLDPHGRAGIR